MDSKLDINLKELVELALNNYSNLEFNKEEVVNSIKSIILELKFSILKVLSYTVPSLAWNTTLFNC